MSDHREPVASVIVPGPSSPNVPSLHLQENRESFNKENLEEVSPLSSCTSIEAKVNGNINKQIPESPVCHSVTAVVPIISQEPCDTLAVPSTSTLAHSVESLLPKVNSPPSNFKLPSTSDNNSIYAGNVLKPSALVNLQSLSRGTTSRPKVPVTETVPDIIPDFLPGKIDAKRFPPRHFDFRSLEIGSWKYESKSMGFFTPTTARLKVIFTQRKLVYEFEIRASNDVLFLKEKQMAAIEVPFSSIVGLNISKNSPCEVTVEVNCAPTMFIGKQQLFSPTTGSARQTKYDTSRSVDCTGGQMSSVPYHKIILSTSQLISRLQSFDPRFDALLRTPITVDVTKRLTRKDTPAVVKHHRKSTDNTGTQVVKKPRKASTSPLTGEIVCSCSSGCSTQRCGCFKMNGKCGSECKCLACKNPLNILDNNGVDVTKAKQDACLMQNITKMKDLDRFLKENIERTPCCDIPLSMKDICIGEIECPECDGEYRFSWCTLSLHDEENRPRNHCAVCKKCGDYRDAHCDKCNKCYFAGSGGSFECYNCSASRRPHFLDSLSAFLGGFHDPEDSSDNEYY